MPRVTIEDRELVIRIPLELVKKLSILEVDGDFMKVHFSTFLTRRKKRSLRAALKRDVEVVEKKPEEKLICISRRAVALG